MINKTFSEKLKKEYREQESERRQIISQSNIILHDSKRVIFALHRGEREQAGQTLADIEKILMSLEKKFGYSRVMQEGAYSAAVEEFVEAKTLSVVLAGKKIEQFKGLKISHQGYLGGLCDLTGELVRHAINEAAKGNFDEADKVKKIINDIMAELIAFDMTGYLRTKYDQAKGNLRKIEQIDYEIKLRKSNNN